MRMLLVSAVACLLLTGCMSNIASEHSIPSQHVVSSWSPPKETWKTEFEQKEREAELAVKNADPNSFTSFEDFVELERRADVLYCPRVRPTDWFYTQPGAVRARAVDDMRRKWYVRRHPELKPTIRNAILAGELVIGMTKEDMWASWTGAAAVHTIVDPNGTFEAWDFILRKPECTVYLQNEIVVRYAYQQ